MRRSRAGRGWGVCSGCGGCSSGDSEYMKLKGTRCSCLIFYIHHEKTGNPVALSPPSRDLLAGDRRRSLPQHAPHCLPRPLPIPLQHPEGVHRGHRPVPPARRPEQVHQQALRHCSPQVRGNHHPVRGSRGTPISI